MVYGEGRAYRPGRSVRSDYNTSGQPTEQKNCPRRSEGRYFFETVGRVSAIWAEASPSPHPFEGCSTFPRLAARQGIVPIGRMAPPPASALTESECTIHPKMPGKHQVVGFLHSLDPEWPHFAPIPEGLNLTTSGP